MAASIRRASTTSPHLAGSGRTSIPVDPEIAKGFYRAAGFRVCGGRAVRVDILERLADLIRPAIAYRPGVTPGEPPPGAADGDGFVATRRMTSLVGCSGEDFASILKSLGYVMERRPGPAITMPLVPPQAAGWPPVRRAGGRDRGARCRAGDARPPKPAVPRRGSAAEASGGGCARLSPGEPAAPSAEPSPVDRGDGAETRSPVAEAPKPQAERAPAEVAELRAELRRSRRRRADDAERPELAGAGDSVEPRRPRLRGSVMETSDRRPASTLSPDASRS